jgi:hypothetical protein
MEEKQYDDTNRGVMYQPRKDQSLRALGKIDNNGVEEQYSLIRQETQDGQEYYNIFKNVGTIYVEDSDNPKAPQYKGYFEERRISMWIKEFNEGHKQAGNKYLSCEIQDKYEGNVVDIKTNEDQSTKDKVKEIENSFEENEDEIPF